MMATQTAAVTVVSAGWVGGGTAAAAAAPPPGSHLQQRSSLQQQFHSPAASSATSHPSAFTRALHITTVTTDGTPGMASSSSQSFIPSGSGPPSLATADHNNSSNTPANSSAMTASDLRSPTSFNTRTSTSSYRSPTKWTHFENEDSDFDEADGDDDNSGKAAVSSDTETRNLLEDADACCSPEPDDSNSHGREDEAAVFANGSDEAAAALLEMDGEQRRYYTKCFLMLLRQTQGTTDAGRALRGADDAVMDFFKKSDLDTEVLSRIWNLADVNEDGWLNLGEFCTAMHLIVLHVKGGVPIPDHLPAHLRPPLTPVRSGPRSTDATPLIQQQQTLTPAAAVTWRNFDGKQPPPSSTTTSNISPKLKHFSGAPPPVERPTPVKVKLPTTAAPSTAGPPKQLPLSPQQQQGLQLLPKGPPPVPPPRPLARGHFRSASLDLNTLIVPPISGNPLHQHQQETINPTVSARPALVIPVQPLRNSVDASVQTDDEMRPPPVAASGGGRASGSAADPQLMDFGDELDEAVRRAISAGAAGRPLDWKQKCSQLHSLNADLEVERARLAQVRLQLELRLQEAKEAK